MLSSGSHHRVGKSGLRIRCRQEMFGIEKDVDEREYSEVAGLEHPYQSSTF